MRQDKISVIIPVYNAGSYLAECIDTLKMQDYPNLEFIIIDDGSTDESSKIIDKYTKNDTRFVVIHQENQGVSSARNNGLKIATGEWISFIDSDDFLEINTYTILMEIIEKYSVEAVMFEYCIEYPNGGCIKHHSETAERYGILNREQAIAHIYDCAPLVTTKLYNRKLVADVIYKKDIYRGEDTIFAVEAFHRAERIYSTDQVLYHYNLSEGSAVRGGINERQLTGIYAMRWLMEFADKNYPKMHGRALVNYINMMIEFYYEMSWTNYKDIKAKQLILSETKHYKKEVMKIVSNRQRIKFRLFFISPIWSCKLLAKFREKKYVK